MLLFSQNTRRESRHERLLRDRDARIDQLESHVSLLELQVTQLSEIVERDRSRVAAETAIHAAHKAAGGEA